MIKRSFTVQGSLYDPERTAVDWWQGLDLLGRRVPGSKPDSTEEPPCNWVHVKNPSGPNVPRWCGVEVWRWGATSGVVHVNFKAGHSRIIQTGIFGTREGKSNLQGRKPMKFKTNYSNRWNSNELKIQHFMRRFQVETPMRGCCKYQETTGVHWPRGKALDLRAEDPKLEPSPQKIPHNIWAWCTPIPTSMVKPNFTDVVQKFGEFASDHCSN
ncbi:hypothetical protein AVEN_222378-1 [Araneus ventricosus]|uniref:Uncharacterized protein n=1 Tax=Araneus ventricosus TaxID=182803 RepID=A0A4Y2EDU6_ARAVE|nr:hypothetical protein AVEN_222378-1 [Araneus ventricosus]